MNLSLELSTSRGLQSRRFLPGRPMLPSRSDRQHNPFHKKHLRLNASLNLVSKLAIQQTESISLSGSLTRTSPNDACFWYKPPQPKNFVDFDLDILLETLVHWLAKKPIATASSQNHRSFGFDYVLKILDFTGSGFLHHQRVIALF